MPCSILTCITHLLIRATQLVAPEMTSSIASASFVLRGFDHDPLEISEALSISASAIWRIGDKLDNSGGVRRPDNGWWLKSSLSEHDLIESQIDEILSCIFPVRDALRGMKLEGKAELRCVLHSVEGDRPSFHISSDDVRRIADLGASLYLDLSWHSSC